MKGIALVMSGPSGAGKSTVIGYLRELLPELLFSISCTTRAPRPGEQDGVHYYFCSKEDFQTKVEAGEMLEYAHVHLDSYGTPASPVFQAVDNGGVMLLDIDVQGARQVKNALEKTPYREHLLTVFLAPPSMEELERRLRGRGTEKEEAILTRLANAAREMAASSEYDCTIVNDDAKKAAAELYKIITGKLNHE